jgi:prepilin-type N-terminal cleavage/methylation domain-containing protein
MKTNSRTSNRVRNHRNKGFTLIEMIGVLAVIAILAAVLIPKIFEAINNARVNNAALTINTCKTAISDHYAKFGSLLSSNGVVIATGTAGALNFDKTLVSEAFLDKPFEVKISSDATNRVQIVDAVPSTTAVDASNAAYDLDGSGASVNDATGSAVVQAVIIGVTAGDAKDLNDRLDGAELGSAINLIDLKGRVKYAATVGGVTDVYVYLTHR